LLRGGVKIGTQSKKGINSREIASLWTLVCPQRNPVLSNITLRLDREDIDWLEEWAKEEFLTIPQLKRVIVKRAVAEYRKRYPVDTSEKNSIAVAKALRTF
jgi:hypothetical protein